MIDRATVLAVDDSETAFVDVPEWGEGQTVRVRSLTGDQRDRFGERIKKHGEGQFIAGGWHALICVMGMIDENGNTLFSEAECAAVGKRHHLVLSRIADKILEMSNMTTESRQAIEKKLAMMPTNDSGSGLPVE